MSLPDGAEYWWKSYNTPKNFLKVKYPPHDCKPRGGVAGTPFRRICKVCGKAFSRESMRQVKEIK